MSNTLINVLLILLIILLIIKIFKFAISKILEISLLLILLYIGINIFQGNFTIFEIFKNFF